ncbi:MAG: hypothetical protein LRY55_01145, partial [Leadbetterella sp.]|nr:hypothetical protein [Leadbetterella sp.]
LGLIVQGAVLNPESKQYNLEKIDLLKTYMEKIGAAQYADMFLWEQRMLANLRAGKPAEALASGEQAAGLFRENGPSLIYVTHVFNDHFPDNTYNAAAAGWLKTARPLLKDNAYLAEYHYELSRLNRRAGDAAGAAKMPPKRCGWPGWPK